MIYRGIATGLAIALTAPLPHPAKAQGGSRPASCELTVDGRSRIKGPCQYRPTGGGGFQISAGDYFAYLSIVGPSLAEASWNGSPRSSHAHVPLGQLKRSGACWSNQRARICARDLPQKQRQAARASQPAGVMLYPEIAAQSCLGTNGPVAIGGKITLRDCRSPRDKIFTVGRDGMVGLHRQPGLCLDMGKANELTIGQCRPATARWKIDGAGGPIRSAKGQCLTIPQISAPNARFPFTVRAEPCVSAGDRAVRFLIERH